ncbi:MAG: MerR family transcriptional regulator [Ignavibacteriae bacterium]|nr:MAG: MerR family transcriptional regulator [Ignavibacteriota bacterium]
MSTNLNFKIPDSQPIYPISVAAKLLGISIHTVRMYEKEGLILPNKSEGNQRLYSKIDLERIMCIRRTINEDKISIAGIRGILSLIPCWELMKCEQTPETCSALTESKQPCWIAKKKSNICSDKDCKTCEVYINLGNCNTIKDKIIELTSHFKKL